MHQSLLNGHLHCAPMSPAEGTLLFAAAAAAGAVNAVAGGGTLLSFPALLGTGMDAKFANATSTCALWPGQLAGLAGYRKDLAGARPILRVLGVASLLGGAAGAALLSGTGKERFEDLVPFLILFATVLFTVSPWLSKRFLDGAEAGERRPGWKAFLFQFVVSVYGGYFGAGAGILMLGAMAFLGMTDIHRMNGVKLVLAALINGVAVAIFAATGLIQWPVAALMAVGASLGGYLGATFARRIPSGGVRVAVVVIGFTVAAVRGWQRFL